MSAEISFKTGRATDDRILAAFFATSFTAQSCCSIASRSFLFREWNCSNTESISDTAAPLLRVKPNRPIGQDYGKLPNPSILALEWREPDWHRVVIWLPQSCRPHWPPKL